MIYLPAAGNMGNATPPVKSFPCPSGGSLVIRKRS